MGLHFGAWCCESPTNHARSRTPGRDGSHSRKTAHLRRGYGLARSEFEAKTPEKQRRARRLRHPNAGPSTGARSAGTGPHALMRSQGGVRFFACAGVLMPKSHHHHHFAIISRRLALAQRPNCQSTLCCSNIRASPRASVLFASGSLERGQVVSGEHHQYIIHGQHRSAAAMIQGRLLECRYRSPASLRCRSPELVWSALGRSCGPSSRNPRSALDQQRPPAAAWLTRRASGAWGGRSACC